MPPTPPSARVPVTPAAVLARRAGLALALLAAAGCGAERATGPTADTFDPSAAFGAAALPNALAAAVTGLGGVAAAAPPDPGAAGVRDCAWSDAERAFACAPRTRGGVTVTAAYTPVDANGQPLRTPTAATTAAVRAVTTVRGTFTPNVGGGPPPRGLALTVDTRDTSTVSGLLAGPRVLDGVSASTVTSAGAPGDGGAFTVRSTQTTAGLVLPENGGRWPLAGTVTTEATFEPAGGSGPLDRAPTATRTVMTFNGTSTVRVDITTAGLARRCTVDLAAPPSAGAAAVQCSPA